MSTNAQDGRHSVYTWSFEREGEEAGRRRVFGRCNTEQIGCKCCAVWVVALRGRDLSFDDRVERERETEDAGVGAVERLRGE